MLNFWASWCVPCKQEAPAIERIWQQYRSKGVVVVGVDTADCLRGRARLHAQAQADLSDRPRRSATRCGGRTALTGVPETRVIDRSGEYARTQFHGATRGSDLEGASSRRCGREGARRVARRRGRCCRRGAGCLASEQHPTLAELEAEVMCLVCKTTLDQSESAFAQSRSARSSARLDRGGLHEERDQEEARRRVRRRDPRCAAEAAASTCSPGGFRSPGSSRARSCSGSARLALEPRAARGPPDDAPGRAARPGARAAARRGARPLRRLSFS